MPPLFFEGCNMTKSEYLSNSAKILTVCSVLLFVANALVYSGNLSQIASSIGLKLSNIAFYVVLIAGFLAFNGEGIAYKRSRDLKGKKKTNILKFFLVFAFLVRYIKKPVEYVGLLLSADSISGTFSRIGLGAFNTVASYGFLFTVVALFYMLRDSGNKKLFYVEAAAFLVGIVNNLYKLFNYSVTKYGLTYLGDFFISVFSNETVLHILSLAQFALDILMCVLVMKVYNKFVSDEHARQENGRKNLKFSRKIYNTECVGIDTMEDDYLTESV